MCLLEFTTSTRTAPQARENPRIRATMGSREFNRVLVAFRAPVPYCLVVRISGSHPEGPGSIPGMGKLFFIVRDHQIQYKYLLKE